VFTWILQRLADAGLVKGKTVGLDGTTLEANAALRSIVRRDTGESYQDFLTKLAPASGIETPTRADLARLDRKRKKEGSNDDLWRGRRVTGVPTPTASPQPRPRPRLDIRPTAFQTRHR
jgi:hypothetical protein